MVQFYCFLSIFNPTGQARVKSAANQIKILDQKGVIDIYSIQLWFGALIGSFSLVYVFWSLFIVEDNPKAHFPAHMLGKVRSKKLELLKKFEKISKNL